MINILMFLPLLIMFVTFGLYLWQAVWVAMDSRKKGEEYWWLWTIVALMTFPVGVIVYALVTRSNVSKCNNCGKEVPSNINSCPYCGEPCGQICTNCGQKVESGWKFCPNCTTELPESIALATKEKKNNKIIVIIVSIFVAVFLLMVGLFIAVGAFSFNVYQGGTTEISYDDSDRFFSRNTYDDPHTGTRSYTLDSDSGSNIRYTGERKNGYVIIKIIDSNDKVIAETEKLKSKDIEGVLDSGLGSYGKCKVVIEFNNFEGTLNLSK